MIKEDVDGNEIVVPLVEGKDYGISAWVCGEMHLLCYLKVDAGSTKSATPVRKLYTNEHPKYWCKDRYNALPHIISNPDANAIIKRIEDSGNSADAGSVSTRRKAPTAKKRASARA